MADEEKRAGDIAVLGKKASLALVDGDIIEASRAYVEAAGLPKECLPSTIQAAISAHALREQVKRELKWDTDRQKRAIGAPKGYVISENKLKECQEFSRTAVFPLSVLYITEHGAISVRATGWRAKLQGDARIFRGFEMGPLEKEVMADGVVVCRRAATLHFWTGDKFPGDGAVSSDEPRAARTPLSFLEMIASTRAQTRATRLAIGLPFEVAEDVISGEEARGTVVQTPSASAGPSPSAQSGAPQSIADLLARAQSELGMRRKDILTKMGVGRLEEISDFASAWAILAGKESQ